ncbi:MAG: hypothetical protein Q8R78_04335 [Candidatus Omnitrophota bacterium]|nr:hypothetical protein [Candidatus Omnitrophota bacterium]
MANMTDDEWAARWRNSARQHVERPDLAGRVAIWLLVFAFVLLAARIVIRLTLLVQPVEERQVLTQWEHERIEECQHIGDEFRLALDAAIDNRISFAAHPDLFTERRMELEREMDECRQDVRRMRP